MTPVTSPSFVAVSTLCESIRATGGRQYVEDDEKTRFDKASATGPHEDIARLAQLDRESSVRTQQEKRDAS
jgi:hypothetical protein